MATVFHKATILFLFTCSVVLVYGQLPQEDSLRKVISEANSPTAKSKAWFELARKYHGKNRDSSILITRTAMALAKEAPISEHKANMIRYYGYQMTLAGKMDSAQYYLEMAEKHCEEEGYLSLMGVVLMDMGTYTRYNGNLNKALSYLEKAREYLAEHNPEKLFMCVNEIGAYCYYAGRQDSAFLIFKEAAQIARKDQKPLNTSMVYMNLGIMYDINGEPDSALSYYKSAIKAGELSGNAFRTGECHMNLGTFYEERNYIKGSIEEFQKAIKYFERARQPRSLFMAYHNISLAYLGIANSKTAYKYLILAEELLKENSFRDGPSIHSKGLAAYYDNVDMQDSVLKHSLKAADAFMEIDRPCEASQQYHHYMQVAAKLGTSYEAVFEKTRDLDSNCSGQVKFDNLQHLGEIYRMQGELDLAEAATNKALEFLRQSNYTKNTMSALETKAGIFEARGDFKSAYATAIEINMLKDSILDIDREQEINYLELQFQESKNEILKSKAEADEQLIASQTATIDQKNRLNITLFLIAFLVVALLGLLLHYRRKDKAFNHELALRNKKVTEQNEIILAKNEELQENNRQKDNLMSVVAHDLGSPLRGIKGLCEFMLDFDEVEGDTKKNIQLIFDSAQNGINLTQELLEANKFLEADNRPKTQFDLAELSNRVIELNKQAAQRKNIVLHHDVDKDLALYTSKESLNRTLDNLISNAIKFSESNKNVWFSARKVEEKVNIRIKDEGQGFSEKDLSKVFQPFQKLSSRPTNNEGSTGLGLSIVKKLVEEINGTIDLKSEKGKGAEFIIELPIEHSGQ